MNNFAVIFDMDGVISHTNPYHADAFRVFFNNYNIAATEEEFQEHMYGKHNSYIFQHFFQKKLDDSEIKTLEEEKEGLFREIYKEHIQALPGFVELLNALKAENIKTGIATSAPEANLRLIAESLDLYNKMESIMYSELIVKHKPNPEIYLQTAKKLQIAPKNCLVFEDSSSGIKAAQAAGMEVCAVLTTHTKEQLPSCQWYIKDFQNLTFEKVQDWMAEE